MRRASLLLCLLLAGCASVPLEGPDGPLLFDEYLVRVRVYPDYPELQSAPGAPRLVDGQLLGWANWQGNHCTVRYVHNDYGTFLHELKHCYYGAWHD